MKSLRKKLEWKHKNNKFIYYLQVLSRELLPAWLYRSRLNKQLASVRDYDRSYIMKRVNYYNKLKDCPLPASAVAISKFGIPKKQRAYYFDTYEYARYFGPKLKFAYRFGDVTYVPDEPSIIKSRPLHPDNTNSVALKLDKLRHFTYTNDQNEFSQKKDMLVGRGVVKQEHRIRFYEMYFNHPMCNLGQINQKKNLHWIKEKLTIEEHLTYKFILCIEGNDVASNLKWVMSSNSLAVMPAPRFETWFMEGTLIPNHHYVHIQDDYSDLEERLTYYIQHPAEALQIIQNANAYVNQFRDKKREDLISLLV